MGTSIKKHPEGNVGQIQIRADTQLGKHDKYLCKQRCLIRQCCHTHTTTQQTEAVPRPAAKKMSGAQNEGISLKFCASR